MEETFCGVSFKTGINIITIINTVGGIVGIVLGVLILQNKTLYSLTEVATRNMGGIVTGVSVFMILMGIVLVAGVKMRNLVMVLIACIGHSFIVLSQGYGINHIVQRGAPPLLFAILPLTFLVTCFMYSVLQNLKQQQQQEYSTNENEVQQ